MLTSKINNLTCALHAALCYYVYGDMKNFDPSAHGVAQRRAEALVLMRLLVSINLPTDESLVEAIRQATLPEPLHQMILPVITRFEQDEKFRKQSKRPATTPLPGANKQPAQKPLARYLVFRTPKGDVSLWEKKMGHARGFIAPKRIRFLSDSAEKHLNVWLLKNGHFIHDKNQKNESIVRKEVLVGNVYRLMNGSHAAKMHLVPILPSENDIDPMPMIASKWIAHYVPALTAETNDIPLTAQNHHNQLRYALATQLLAIEDLGIDNYGYYKNAEVSEIHVVDFGVSSPGKFHLSLSIGQFENILTTAQSEEELKQGLQDVFDLEKLTWPDIQRELRFLTTLKEADIEAMGRALLMPELASQIAQNLTQVKNAIKRCTLLGADRKRASTELATPPSPPKLMRFTVGGLSKLATSRLPVPKLSAHKRQ